MTRRWLSAALTSAALIVTTGCAPSADLLMPRYDAGGPHPAGFVVCHGYGCAYETRIALTASEWQRVRALFEPPPGSAAAERSQISAAVALLERAVGERTGTSAHQRRQILNAGDRTQVDCVDEAIDTWTYLTLLERDGLLRYHAVGAILHRAGMLGSAAHNTAVLIARGTAERFAVDPDLVDAAQPPPILPVSAWLGPWPPTVSTTDAMMVDPRDGAGGRGGI